MLWLKRNLFVAIGGLVTGLLLLLGIYYVVSNLQENKSIESELEEKKDQLDKLSKKDPYPSKANIAIVKGEAQKLRDGIAKIRAHFSPIPVQRVRDKDFTLLLDNAIAELRKKADQLNVGLPGGGKTYAFSFMAEKDKLSYRGGFPALPEQLAEIKTICQILFDAKINRLLNIRRTPVSGDDELQKSSGDYHDLRITVDPVTGTVSRLYQFEFECFSSELATVLESLHKSKFALHVKGISVEPAAASSAPGGVAPPPGPTAPMTAPPPNPRLRGRPVGTAPGTPLPGGVAAAAAGGQDLKTVLAERMLKTALLIEVIQPQPGK